MSLVQKRQYVEPSSTIQIESEIQKKRIKIHARSSAKSIKIFLKRLETSSSSHESLQILTEISDCPNLEDVGTEAINSLSILFQKEKGFVRMKILYLFSDFVLDHDIDACLIIEEIIMLIKKEESSKVINQGFNSICRIGQQQKHQIPFDITKKIIEFAKLKISSTNHNVQRHAIQTIGAFANKHEGDNELVTMISCYMDSSDARIRAQAINSLLNMSYKSILLPPSIYSRAEKALKDDYECGRKEAIQLIFVLSQTHPEHLIKVSDSQSEIRLIDDAFAKICSALSDLSVQVRAQAAKLLGGMCQVNNEFLCQTLDKKLMSNMRRKKTSHERALENYTSGEWSSGRKWADDAPQEYINSDSISLIESGACGALVQGLEDEFLEVRMASVNALCQLALINPPFAELSLDFLVDMFNDEIESVRLQAIYSLTKISQHIILREDQIEVMLGSLEDYSAEVREGLHLMFGACKVSTRACLTMVVQKILDVLSKYPQDKLSAYGCLQKVGSKHPELCMSLTPQLLQVHPFFDSAEKDVEDPTYVCVLILLFNAAKNLPPMLSLFPETILKHYDYLRDTMPNFVPHLVGGNQSEVSLGGASGSRQFLETLVANIKATNFSKTARQGLLTVAQENLNRLASIDPGLSGTANFMRDFLGAQLLMEQLQSNIMTHRIPSRESLQQLIYKCLQLQNLFSNLTLNDLLVVKQICFRASALNLVLVVKDKSQSALSSCQLLLHIANDVKKFLRLHPGLPLDSFTESVLSFVDTVVDPKPGRISRGIVQIVQAANLWQNPMEINFEIKMCTAKIIEPDNSTSVDNIVKVTAGLIAALPLTAEIVYLQDHQCEDLRIKIKYPDQNVYIVVPRRRDLKKIMPESEEVLEANTWRLRTNVLLSHGIWTETSQVELSICLAVKPSNELELSKPIKIFFAPKPIRKGI
ncbi:CLUMA_CG011852, isoform A [Clunio marinus]|uniref:CLUMA_CG011852, isoform A n=1 Tax=Clunio marinus TaxID=568069 RepID=A0A1J1IDZ5_9DIPT|nr:CLUMA_CG011852, isoform A [Clunio marinus]